MAVKPRTQTKTSVKSVAYCRVAVGMTFTYNQQKYLKYAPFKAISTSGKVLVIPDNAIVRVKHDG